MKQLFVLVYAGFLLLNTAFAQNSAAPMSLLIHFETDSDQLGADQKLALDIVFGPLMSRKDRLRVTISGHTDSRGSADYNRSLSLRRGAAVAAWLKERGMAADRIQVFAAGETSPTDDNQTDDGKAKNRRVEVIFEEETPADSWMDANSVPMAMLLKRATSSLFSTKNA